VLLPLLNKRYAMWTSGLQEGCVKVLAMARMIAGFPKMIMRVPCLQDHAYQDSASFIATTGGTADRPAT